MPEIVPGTGPSPTPIRIVQTETSPRELTMHSDHTLRVVMYHYVRDLPRTQFPRLKGILLEDFRHQVNELSSQYEMASVESALDFMTGEYRPRRDLCLLTFDDGLKEHYTDVTPILAEKRIRGVFFLI